MKLNGLNHHKLLISSILLKLKSKILSFYWFGVISLDAKLFAILCFKHLLFSSFHLIIRIIFDISVSSICMYNFSAYRLKNLDNITNITQSFIHYIILFNLLRYVFHFILITAKNFFANNHSKFSRLNCCNIELFI